MCLHITCFVFHIACFLFHIPIFLLLIICQSEKQFLSTSCWGFHMGLFVLFVFVWFVFFKFIPVDSIGKKVSLCTPRCQRGRLFVGELGANPSKSPMDLFTPQQNQTIKEPLYQKTLGNPKTQRKYAHLNDIDGYFDPRGVRGKRIPLAILCKEHALRFAVRDGCLRCVSLRLMSGFFFFFFFV